MWRFRTVVGCVAPVCLNTFRTRLNPLRVGHVSGLQAGFVQANVLVIVSIRFRLRAEASWSTMDREAGTKGTIAPGFAGAETCGGVMVRGPKSGNGTRSPVYYLDSAGLVPPRPRARELYSEMDPLAAGMLADGSLAADPGIGGSWQGGGGRWLLWPLRVVLWGALLVIAFRGITAIVFNTACCPGGRRNRAAERYRAVSRHPGRGLRGGVRPGVPQLQPAESGPAGAGPDGLRAGQCLGGQSGPGLERHWSAQPAGGAGGGHHRAGSAARRRDVARPDQRPAHAAWRAGCRLGPRRGGHPGSPRGCPRRRRFRRRRLPWAVRIRWPKAS